jgi:hypothetical protein
MTMRPTFDSRATASMAVSTSLASCMADDDNRTPNDGAVASITRKRPAFPAFPAFTITSTWLTLGAISLSACPGLSDQAPSQS